MAGQEAGPRAAGGDESFSTLTADPSARDRCGPTSRLAPPTTRFDYIIVGGGSAGCVLASRLAEESEASVLLLEAGGDDDIPSIHTPNRWVDALDTRAGKVYETVPQPHTAGRVHHWPRGNVIGGSSAINALIYVRGHRSDFDSWAKAGATGWDFESLLPAFKAMEDFEGGASATRGVGGRLHVSTPQPGKRHPGAEVFAAAVAAMGFPIMPDLNGAELEGAGWSDLTIRNGRRESAAVAFLRPALSRKNLTVLTQAPALRLLIESGRCTGVRYSHAGRAHDVRADGEVILCSGAIESPKLLMLSGLGSADDLSRLGIAPVQNLPGVGQNLQDHLLLGGIVYEAQRPLPPSAYNHSEFYLWTRSDPALIAPDLFIHHHCRVFANLPLAQVENGYTLVPGVARCHSRGTIRLASADPSAAPIIDPNYLSDERDRRALLAAVKLTREIGAHPAFDSLRSREVLPGPGPRSDADLERFAAEAVQTFFHPTSTCRIGNDAESVVDPALRVHGVEGLRIADASVMPTNTCANTNAPSMVIGWKAADLILG